MDIQIGESLTYLSGDGDTEGYVTVASNAIFYPGTYLWIYGDTAASAYCLITELSGSTMLRLLIVPAPGHGSSYGDSDMSTYTVTDNARMSVPAQPAPVSSITPITKLTHS